MLRNVVVSFAACLTLSLVLSLAGCGTTPAGLPVLEPVYTADFEDGEAGGWALEPGWQVVEDGSNLVLSGQGHAWARLGTSYGDIHLSFRVKLAGGTVHLVFRMNDTGRYFIGFHDRGSSLSKQYWPETFRHDLAGSAAEHRAGAWHRVEIVGNGNTIRFLVNGRKEWEYRDPDPLLDGAFAFETQAASRAFIDDVEVAVEAAVEASDRVAAAAPGSTSREAWRSTGGPLGGLGYDVRMRPHDPDVMYVTDSYAGVFKSTDGGRTWFASNTGITTRTGATGDAIPVFSLTIDPVHPDTIWAGMQNTRGIYKSVDAGRTWRKMDNGVTEEGISFRGFTVDPEDSDTVYAAAELSSWEWNHGQPRQGLEFDMVAGVVYKTTNGGASWKAVWRGENLARYVWIDPRDRNVVYVSTGIFDREAANSDPATRKPGGVGIVKSTDGGKTWKAVNNGLGNLYVGTLFMHPTNPDILIAGTGAVRAQEGAGAYITTNGGASWRQTLSCIFIESIEISTADPDIAYAGNAYGVWRSTDSGRTWRLVAGRAEADNRYGWGSPGVRAGHPIDFQADPRDPNRLFANAYGGGNFVSEDGGRTWQDVSKGYTGALVRDIAVDPSAPGRVIAASRSGIFGSSNGGEDWEGLSFPALYCSEWEAVAVDPADPRHLVASNNWVNALANSTDGGRTWKVAAELPGNAMTSWRAIAFAPSAPSTVYAGSAGYLSAGSFDGSVPGKGIHVSRNGGASWQEANDEISRNAHVTDLAVDPKDPARVFAATFNHGVLLTTDAGRAWSRLGGGLPSESALSVAISPDDPAIVCAGFDRRALFRSADGGRTWKRSASGLPAEASVSSVVFDPARALTVYASDLMSGVYRSLDGGITWRQLQKGLSTRAVNALAVSADGQHLYAATEGGGVYRLDLNE